MMKNPLVWASIFALLFLAWKRDEIVTSKINVSSPQEVKTKIALSENTTDQFQDLGPIATQDILSKQDLPYIREHQAHNMRYENNKTGKIIGRLVQRANEKPGLRKVTLNYFLQCAEDQNLPQSTRALCWWKLTNKIIDWKVFVPISEAKVPMNIQHLAMNLNLENREI